MKDEAGLLRSTDSPGSRKAIPYLDDLVFSYDKPMAFGFPSPNVRWTSGDPAVVTKIGRATCVIQFNYGPFLDCPKLENALGTKCHLGHLQRWIPPVGSSAASVRPPSQHRTR